MADSPTIGMSVDSRSFRLDELFSSRATISRVAPSILTVPLSDDRPTRASEMLRELMTLEKTFVWSCCSNCVAASVNASTADASRSRSTIKAAAVCEESSNWRRRDVGPSSRPPTRLTVQLSVSAHVTLLVASLTISRCSSFVRSTGGSAKRVRLTVSLIVTMRVTSSAPSVKTADSPHSVKPEARAAAEVNGRVMSTSGEMMTITPIDEIGKSGGGGGGVKGGGGGDGGGS